MCQNTTIVKEKKAMVLYADGLGTSNRVAQ
jgi:hypothetical protein